MRAGRPLAGGLALAALAALAVLPTGCARPAGPPEQPDRSGTERVRAPRTSPSSASSASSASSGPAALSAPSAAPPGPAADPRAPQPAWRRWGLAGPHAAAPERADRPPAARGPLPPVVDRVRTRDRVVFLTYDDGAERDPRLTDLIRELRLPVTLFLTGTVAGPGYARLAGLRAVGAGLQNRTLGGTHLGGLPYAGQRAAICGQRDRLHARFGLRPRLLRPPHGALDATTLRAAADCGVTAVVRWSAELTGARPPVRPEPGAILSLPSGDPAAPSLLERTLAVLREIRRRGFAVGGLENYL